MKLIKTLTNLCTLIFLLTSCSTDSKPTPAELTDYQPSAEINQAWHANAGKGVADSNLTLQPSIQDDIIYTADTKGHLAAFALNNGHRIWRRSYGLPFSSNIASTKQAIYIGTNKAELLKVDANTGDKIWQITLPSALLAAPLVIDGMVFVKTIDGQVSAYHDNDGKTLWHYQQTNPPLILRNTSNLALANDQIVAGFANGYLALLSAENGNPTWEKQVTTPEGATDVERMVDIDATPIVLNHTLYTATYQGEIVALRESTGNTIWSRTSSIYNNIVVDKNTVYATDEDSFIWAFDKDSGEALWHQKAFKNRGLSAPAVADHFLFVGDKAGYLHVLNTEDGKLMARTKVDSAGISSAPMITKGKVLVFSNAGKLAAYKVSDKK